MIASDSLVTVDAGSETRPASQIVKGDKLYNPVTDGFSIVSFVSHHKVRILNGTDEHVKNSAPVRIEAGSINGRYPTQTLRVAQSTLVLHKEKIASSSLSRIITSRAAHLVNLPGVFVEGDSDEMSYTKIVLTAPGLICVCGLLIEAPVLSLVRNQPVDYQDQMADSRENQYITANSVQ